MAGWYWQEMVDCLDQSIHDLRFGPALLWIVIAMALIRLFNRMIMKD